MQDPVLIIESDEHHEPGEEVAVRISNPDAENGFGECDGPLWWLNSARIVADPSEDSVTCLVSIGDPRGAFALQVRRLEDGRMVIHTPHQGETMPHMDTAELLGGTLVVLDRPDDRPSIREAAREVLRAYDETDPSFHGKLDDALETLRDTLAGPANAATFDPPSSDDDE